MVDAISYAQRLFAPGEDVWMDSGRHVEIVRLAQRLVGSAVLEVRLDAFHRAAFAADPSRADPHRGRRLTTALRRLLEESRPTSVTIETSEALAALYPRTPVVLVLDGIHRWLQWAASGIGNGDEIDADSIDAAAVYVADAIRPFGSSAVSGIALDLRGAAPGESSGLFDVHRPVRNLAGDYGWPMTVIVDDAAAALAVGQQPVDAVLCPSLGFEVLAALDVPARLGGGLDPVFWSDPADTGAPDHVLAYGEIPAEAQPEVVLTRLAQLRNE